MIQNRLMIMIINVLIAEIFRVLTYFFYLFIFLKDSEFLVVDNFFENSNFLEWVCQLKKKKNCHHDHKSNQSQKRESQAKDTISPQSFAKSSPRKRKKSQVESRNVDSVPCPAAAPWKEVRWQLRQQLPHTTVISPFPVIVLYTYNNIYFSNNYILVELSVRTSITVYGKTGE